MFFLITQVGRAAITPGHPPGRVGDRPAKNYHEGVTGRPGPTYDAGMTRRGDGAAGPGRVVLTGGPLGVGQVVAVARGRVPVELGEEGRKRMAAARDVVERAVTEGRQVYGVSTGFGLLANTAVAPADLEELQRRIVLSHATATGDPLETEVVRGMQLLRARTLTQGYSGVRPLVVEALLALLAAGITPVIPEHGSVGASGDLAQLAHLALPLLGEGEVLVDGRRLPAAEGLRQAGLEPLRLSFKEGLSLVNGTEGMLALACLAVADAEALAAMADVACAMSIEGLLGTDRPFQARLHELRPHPGQVASAANLRTMLAGSPILASHRHSDHAIQDAYSLRCAPQVHGACRDVIAFARQVVERELGSVTDNPVVFAETGEVISVGNFHGEPLAFVLDFLAIALAELADISERRVDRLLDPALNHDLPPFLARDPGLNSGLMLTQYTAAALVADCKVLAHPASVDSIPTSGNQEDHVSMGWTAGLKLRRVVANVRRALAIEALCAAQAIDLRGPLRPGAAVAAVLGRVREQVPPLDEDRYLAPDLAAVEHLVADGTLVAAAEEVAGPLG